MLRRLLFLLFIAFSPGTAHAVLVGAKVTATRLDLEHVRLAVEDVLISTDADLYDLFQVPRTSPFGDPVYLGAYGSPWSVIQGAFGTPFDLSLDAELLASGEVLGRAPAYAFSIASPPYTGRVMLSFFAAQDYFYEYPLPDGSVVRGLSGQLTGGVRFAGEIPRHPDEAMVFTAVPEPASFRLWAAVILMTARFTLSTRRRVLRRLVARACMLFARRACSSAG